MNLRFGTIWLIFFMFSPNVYAADKLHIINSDSLTSEMTPEGPVRILHWNVHLRQGDADLYCDHVQLYDRRDEIVLYQNVRYIDSEKSLKADKIIYNKSNRLAHASGRVVVVDSLHTLKAQKVTYNQQTEVIIANEDVLLTDGENEIQFTGQHAEYRREEKYAKVTGGPILIRSDSTGQEELRITGLEMEVLNGGDKAIVTDSVHIIHKDGNTTCQQAEFYKEEEYALLKTDPVMHQQFDEISGEEVEMRFQDKELKQVIISINALVTSPVDTLAPNGLMNRLNGDKITIELDQRKLKKVLVEGKATSHHYVVEKDESKGLEEYKGLNKVIADKITMYLKNSKPEKIIFESNPGTSDGIYYPPEFDIKEN